MKKPSSKTAQNHPPTFLCTGPAAQTAQKQKSCTTKSSLMQDWVFRLVVHHLPKHPWLDFVPRSLVLVTDGHWMQLVWPSLC